MPFRTAALFCCWIAVAGAAEDVSVEAVRRGSAVEVQARATLAAPHSLIWGTLTDYNRLAEFIPGMRRSRVVEVRGSDSVVEQSGEARLLVFTFPIDVTLLSTPRPPGALDVRVLKGNLKRLEGGYRIEPADEGRYLLRWSGVIEPDAPLPPLLGEAVMRHTIELQFIGMVREIERREGLRRRNEPGRKE
jgi:ribosome-associated toxin RatA of RatAB toxin-antitoxin module